MGCAASKAAAASPPPATENVPKPPVAFEIPVDETTEANNKEIKLPPQLSKRLEEQNNQNNLSVEELKQKQEEAEKRRQAILEEKARVARQAQKMFNKGETQNGEHRNGDNEGS